jgi:hypothetical protein
VSKLREGRGEALQMARDKRTGSAVTGNKGGMSEAVSLAAPKP